jgi:peptide deformylase
VGAIVSVRPIRSIGDPVLRVAGEPVDPADIAGPEVQQLIDDLIDTMRDANGAGLAANQIGVGRRVVVMEVTHNPRYPYKPPIPLTVAINPILEPLDDETVMINEGCLSVPVRGEVPRYVNIRARYLDRDGIAHDEVKRGLTAGTWQHECDHLDGVLIVDRVVDPRTLSTWAEYEAHHRDAFVARITDFVRRVGS